MSPLTPRQLLDLAAQQQVEGIDLVSRIVSLTPTPSPTGREENALTPAPSPTGRGEVDSLSLRERARVRDNSPALAEVLTPDPSPTGLRTWVQGLRAKPALIVLLLFLALALISGAAYALGRSLGYLPGIGLVEQGSPLRVLAEPVSQTRDGITLTVREAVLTSERTVILMTIENLPWRIFGDPEDSPLCAADPQVRLPNGDTLTITAGRASANAEGRWELRWTYGPIPPQVNQADFLVSCIQGALPDKAPEDWLFKLRFVPAPPDLTVMPVQEVPTPLPATPSQPEHQTPEGWRLEKVIETETGYILVGTFHLSHLPYNAMVLGFSEWPSIIDAFGNPVPARPASDLDLSSSVPGEIPWSLEIEGKQHAWPLTIRVQGVDAQTTELSAQFSVDVGERPQPGQEWAIGKTIQLGEMQVEVQRVRFSGRGYEFEMKASDPLRHVELAIEGATAHSGYGSSDDQGNVQVGLEFETPPTGQLQVRISGVLFRLQGDWSFQWMPEDAQGRQSLFGIRLVLDKTVELEDGYILVGHLEWEDERIQLASTDAHLFATDAKGNRLPLEIVSFDVLSQLAPNFSNSRWETWAYRLAGKDFLPPVTLHLQRVNVMLTSPLSLTIDLQPQGFAFDEAHSGASYELGSIPLEGLPAFQARLVRVTYVRQQDLHGFEFTFETGPRLAGLTVQLTPSLIAGTGQGRSLIESSFDELSGFLIARSLTDAEMNLPLTLEISDLQVQGDWTVEWGGQ